MRYQGYNGLFVVDGDALLIIHEGAVAKVAGLSTGSPRRVPLASISGVSFRAAGLMSNGWLAIGSNGQLAPELRTGTAASSQDAVLFRRKDQGTFEAMQQWLRYVVEQNRQHVKALPQESKIRRVPGSGAPPAPAETPELGPQGAAAAAPSPPSTTRNSSRYQTARPSGRPIDAWAVQTEPVGVAGESFHDEAFRAIVKRRGLSIKAGAEIPDATAHLAVDLRNPYDANAVAVWIDNEHVGFLPRSAAELYQPALAELTDEHQHLTVLARVWAASSWDEDGIRASVSLSMPPASGVQPFNAFPEVPFLVLPSAKATMQVTGEEDHMDWLRRYIADQPRHLVVSLHLTQAQVGPRSKPYDQVEIRLDGLRVGALSRQMSDEVSQLISHAAITGRTPVCRAVLKGSPLRAEVTLHVAKSSQVTSRWLKATSTIIE